MTTYLGFDVLEVQPEPVDDQALTFARALQMLDSITGRLVVIDRSGVVTLHTNPFSWIMHSREEVASFRAFRDARRGMLVPFWCPSWRNDLVLRTQLDPGQVALTIARTGYTRYQFSQIARRYLTLFAGTVPYYRKVLASVEGDSTEVLTLDSALPVALAPGASRLSFLLLSRLAADDPELDWQTTTVATADLEFVELPKEVPL